MGAPLPPVYRDCRRLLLHTEVVVRRFSRYHKYTVGTDLRQQAFAVMRGVHQAVYDRAQQASHIQALVWRVDDYKLTLQLAIEVGAFMHGKGGAQKPTTPGFAAFETSPLLASQIGKQCGGWHKAVMGMAAQGGQATAGPPAAKPASALRAKAGTGAQAAGAVGPKPPATLVPATCPASLSERTASVPPKRPAPRAGRRRHRGHTMTMPCYPQGCAAELQNVCSGLAATTQQGWGCKPRPPMRAMPTTPGPSISTTASSTTTTATTTTMSASYGSGGLGFRRARQWSVAR